MAGVVLAGELGLMSVGAASNRSAPTFTRVPLRCSVAGELASWSLDRLAAETLGTAVPEDDVGSVAHEVAMGIGGIILFGSVAPPDLGIQLAALEARAPEDVKPLVMTDEEGGLVQRMPDLVGSMPAARTMGASMDPAQIEVLATKVGRRMLAAGVTMDLAPVLDVDGGVGPNARDPDGTRSFSANVAVAAKDGLAFAAGLERAGVIAVVKHFPGLGGVSGNTDVGPAATIPWSRLARSGLVPFVDAIRAGVQAVMVANASVPGLTSQPASLSKTVETSLLRGRLHFKGLIVTDALTAPSISAKGLTVPEAAVAALQAGADLLLYQVPSGSTASLTNEIVAAIVKAVEKGRLSRPQLVAAVSYVLAAKRVDLCADA
ncbi:MAG TPA: glycoside hydrolase family 3 N-terminal domain-containing protein [Acidimicrobiales bacterium]|nr:glycoside hydrolase family 3 N-terminal domain-containing protein [Acidimicrobiales bacterium]